MSILLKLNLKGVALVRLMITDCFITIASQLYCCSWNTVTTANSAQGRIQCTY